MTDTLKAEVRRRMATGTEHSVLHDMEPFVRLSDAVAVAVEMIEKERALYESAEASAIRNGQEREAERKRAEAAERREELAHVAAAQALTYRDEARKALAEHREKWRHTRNCRCCDCPQPGPKCPRDPRCAPAPEEKAGD